MTCHEARDLYSALVDDALGESERVSVEAHVDGCAECRRELDRFRQTVALLRRVTPARAPVGFVDRVVEAARPVAWHRRLWPRLLSPLRVKLPLGAAAMLVVGAAAVYVFQHTPELRQAARQEAPAPAPTEPFRPTATPTQPPPAAAPPAPVPTRPKSAAAPAAPAPPAGAKESSQPSRRSELEAAKPPASPDRAAGAIAEVPKQTAPPAEPAESQRDARQEAAPPSGATTVAAPAGPALSAPPPPAGSPAPEPKATMKSTALDQATPEGARERSDVAAPRAQQEVAARLAGPAQRADLSGLLSVVDRAASLRGVDELVARAGGREISRRQDGGLAVVELLIPRAALADFVQGLAGLGSWAPDAEPASLPAQVRVTLRIGA